MGSHVRPPDRGLHLSQGAWFGAQIGGSLWMALAGLALVLRGAPALGALVLALFAAVNVLGLWLWRRRAPRAPLAAVQTFLVALGIASFAAVASTDLAGHWEAIQVGGRVPASWTYLLLALMFPLLLWRMWLVDRRGRDPGSAGSR